MKTIYPSLLLLSLFCLLSVNLLAQDEFEEVKVLDHQRYSLTHRFSVDTDLTFLPLDAYYKPILVEAAISYQPVDWFSWEVGRVGYSLSNYDTGFRDMLTYSVSTQTGQAYTISDSELKLKNMRAHVSSTGFFNMLYSKSNLFNLGVVYYYWQLGGGISYYDMKDASQMGLDLAVRVRFFINNHFMVNLRGGQTLGFKSDAPKNITFLGLGVGFAL